MKYYVGLLGVGPYIICRKHGRTEHRTLQNTEIFLAYLLYAVYATHGISFSCNDVTGMYMDTNIVEVN